MKKSISTAMMALAALVLIFCIAFTVVQLSCSNFGFFEEEFIKLGLDTTMHMTVGDISKGLQALVEYMNGKVDTIDVNVMIDGVVTPMYALDIEHIHMEEVREVWRAFDTARNLGFLVAALLVLGAFVTDGKHSLRNGAVGYLWALGTALVLCLFLGVWAGTSFNSFWTQFHKIIFPNSDNWLLPGSSRMIQMLPGDLFQDLVMHCGLIIILILVALGAGAVAALVVPKKKEEKNQAAADGDSKKAEAHPHVLEQNGPDLVLMHKLLNMSVSRRKKVEAELMLERAKAEEEAKKAGETGGEETAPTEENARVKIAFAAYEGEEDAPQADEEEQEEAEWFRTLAENAKAKAEGGTKKKGKPSSKKKKKKSTAPKVKPEGKEPAEEAPAESQPEAMTEAEPEAEVKVEAEQEAPAAQDEPAPAEQMPEEEQEANLQADTEEDTHGL